MRARRIILAALALAGLVARFAIGMPGAFSVLGIAAIVGLPLALAFAVADAVPMRRAALAASLIAAVGLPVALQPQWGWVALVLVIAAQAAAWPWRPAPR